MQNIITAGVGIFISYLFYESAVKSREEHQEELAHMKKLSNELMTAAITVAAILNILIVFGMWYLGGAILVEHPIIGCFLLLKGLASLVASVRYTYTVNFGKRNLVQDYFRREERRNRTWIWTRVISVATMVAAMFATIVIIIS